MTKEVRYSTVLKDHNKELAKKIGNSKKGRALVKLAKSSTKSIFLINFDHADKHTVFDKFHLDVDTVILNANAGDEVYLSIKTPGGPVTEYADAACQIQRLRDAGLVVTGFIDEIAASGGYMMAAVCNKIVAEKMAFVGSIGVVSQMPIVEELLKKIGVDFKVYTAGRLKRTVVPTRQPTQEDEDAYKEKLEVIHSAFKKHVLHYRPQIDENRLMEGDFYLAGDVVAEHVVDELGDSRTAVLNAFKEGVQIFQVHTSAKQKRRGLAGLFGVDSALESVIGTRLDAVIHKIFQRNMF